MSADGGVFLTFDDGPSPATTNVLLDLFDQLNVKVAFFVLGARMSSRQEIATIRRAARDGHSIGNHSFSHARLRDQPRVRIRDELSRTHDLICRYAGECRFFRSPYGLQSEIVDEIVDEFGYKVANWNVDSLDWKLRAAYRWIGHTLPQIESNKNSVVLFHDIYPSTVSGMADFLRQLTLGGRCHLGDVSLIDALGTCKTARAALNGLP